MKSLKTYLLIGLLTIIIAPATAFSQTLDANRMNRDIRIMENILGELFKTQITPSTHTLPNQTFVVTGSGVLHADNVRGTYLPGFGVIFNVSNSGTWGSSYRVLSGGGENGYTFYYDTDSNDKKAPVDQESITSRIQSFLKDYASTIGQLRDDERVMVIFGNQGNNSRLYARLLTTSSSGQKTTEEKEEIPVISVSTKVSDLKEYRTGKINASKFEDRLAIATSKDKEYLDLTVMGNIFKTALDGQEGEAFRLSGGVNHLMLDNFGALFSLDVRYSTGSRGRGVWDFNTVLRGRVETAVSVNSQAQYTDAKIAEEKEELNKRVNQAYSSLLTNLKEYIVDYGRTLSSLNNDQYLLLSITINGRFEDIPERIDLQVKKSVLQQLDRGSISRGKAIAEVFVNEY